MGASKMSNSIIIDNDNKNRLQLERIVCIMRTVHDLLKGHTAAASVILRRSRMVACFIFLPSVITGFHAPRPSAFFSPLYRCAGFFNFRFASSIARS